MKITDLAHRAAIAATFAGVAWREARANNCSLSIINAARTAAYHAVESCMRCIETVPDGEPGKKPLRDAMSVLQQELLDSSIPM